MPERDPQLTYEELVRLVELIKSTSHFSEFRLKVGEIEVSLRRSNGAVRPQAVPIAQPAVAAPVDRPGIEITDRQFEPGLHLVRAPMVGTFYRAPAPDQPPYTAVGQRVEPGATVCIIEVMKLLNSIPAGCAGVVTHDARLMCALVVSWNAVDPKQNT